VPKSCNLDYTSDYTRKKGVFVSENRGFMGDIDIAQSDRFGPAKPDRFGPASTPSMDMGLPVPPKVTGTLKRRHTVPHIQFSKIFNLSKLR